MASRLTTRLCASTALLVGIGAGGLALAGPAQAASADLQYTCTATNLGITFEDPWAVTLEVDVPEQVEPGESIPAPGIVARVTPGDDATSTMRAVNIKTLEGTASAAYTVGAQERTADLTVPKVSVPDEGSVTTVASGSGEAETAPDEPGELPIAAGDFTARLTTDSGFVLNLSCTAPADASVGSIQVGAAPTTSPSTSESSSSTTSSSSSTTSEPSSTTTSSATTSSTSAPSSTTTAAPSSTSAPAASATPEVTITADGDGVTIGVADDDTAAGDGAAADPQTPGLVQTDAPMTGSAEPTALLAAGLGVALLLGAGGGGLALARRRAGARH